MLLQIFGVGNDLARWFFSDYMHYSLYLFNYINRLVMNEWNKVEKRKRIAKESDIRWEYVKMTLWIIAGITYLYFTFRG